MIWRAQHKDMSKTPRDTRSVGATCHGTCLHSMWLAQAPNKSNKITVL